MFKFSYTYIYRVRAYICVYLHTQGFAFVSWFVVFGFNLLEGQI